MTWKTSLFRITGAIAFALAKTISASAIMITVAPGGSPTNSSTLSLGGPSGDRAAVQSVSYTDLAASSPDFVGATIDIQARHISNAVSDRDSAFSGGTASAGVNVDYNFSFTVTPIFSGTIYEIDLDTALRGALTRVRDHTFPGPGKLSVSNVSGFLDAAPNAGLSLSSATSIGSGDSAVNQDINFSNSTTLGPFSGAQTFNVRFTFQTFTDSAQNVAGAVETAARFGANGPLGKASADDYPGVGDRNQANDGHFVTVTARVLAVPEPSSLVLFGTGLVGLIALGWRRTK